MGVLPWYINYKTTVIAVISEDDKLHNGLASVNIIDVVY